MLKNKTDVNVTKNSDWNKIHISVISCHVMMWRTHAWWHFNIQRLVSHFAMTMFLLWSVLQNVTGIVMTNSDWNKIMWASRALLWRSEIRLTDGATITCLVTLCATNSWSVTWSWHFLSVIITKACYICCRGRHGRLYTSEEYVANKSFCDLIKSCKLIINGSLNLTKVFCYLFWE